MGRGARAGTNAPFWNASDFGREAEVSGLWRNDMSERAKPLRFSQSIGTAAQFCREALN
jgi:hypothetical protein